METKRALTAEGVDSIGEQLAPGAPIIVSSSAMVGTVDGGRSERVGRVGDGVRLDRVRTLGENAVGVFVSG
jgi:hypothetical protein